MVDDSKCQSPSTGLRIISVAVLEISSARPSLVDLLIYSGDNESNFPHRSGL
ncbi:hypothetical protein J6590_047967 [Homalodisca vitripennis]|nr:hypothetical protein J6590_047967 [Homalodisca vitripennis]